MIRRKIEMKKSVEVRPSRNCARFPHLRELSLIYEGRPDVICIHPPDISTQGMFINTTLRYPEGTVLKLRFRLARTYVEIFARGEVRYCLPGVGIGVQFLELASEAARAIEKEIQVSSNARSSRRR
jgi:hypothetical protein